MGASVFQRAWAIYGGSGRGGELVRTMVRSAGLRVAGMALGFLVGVQLARMLGPADYGIYGIAMALFSIAMISTELSAAQLVTRETAIAEAGGDRAAVRSLLGWALRFVLGNWIVIALLAWIFIVALRSRMPAGLLSAVWWGVGMLPLVALAAVSSAALRGMRQVVKGQVFEMLLRPGVVSLALFLIWATGKSGALTPGYCMALNVLSATIGAVVMVCWLAPRLRGVPFRSAPRESRQRWLRSTLPLALSEGMRILSGNLAILLLGWMAPAAEVGLYRVAAGVYAAATLPAALVYVVCSPMLASLHAEGDIVALRRLNAWMALLLALTGLACLLPFVFAGGAILSFAFGDAYAAANVILVILLAGELAAGMLGRPVMVLNMLRHERAATRYSLISLLVNVTICVSLIPAWGVLGAACGNALAQVVWRVLAAGYARHQLGIETTLLAWRGRDNGSRG